MAIDYDKGNFSLIQTAGARRDDCDLDGAAGVFRPLNGMVLVEMDYAPEMIGSLYVPDDVGAYRRPDRGTVMVAGDGVWLSPGQTVYVGGYDGMWVDGYEHNNFKTKGELRFYGHNGMDWHECILAVEEDGQLKATGRNVIIEKEERIKKTASGLYLPDGSEEVTGQAFVRAVGEDVNEVAVGDKVVYSLEHVRNFDGFELGVIPIDHIWGVVLED